LKDNHEFYGASCGKGVNYVSPNDVADVAVKAIFEKAHKRQTYTLTGPAAITDEEVAKLLSEQLGTKITYVEKPLKFFDTDTASLEKIKATGLEEENFPKGDIKKVVGRNAETFEEYLKAKERMSPIEQEALSWAAPVKEVEGVTPEKEEEKEEEIETLQTDVTPEKEKETEEIEPTETVEVEVAEKKVQEEVEVEVAEKKEHEDVTPQKARPAVEAQ